jgi:AcrR family transcriptional regulator
VGHVLLPFCHVGLYFTIHCVVLKSLCILGVTLYDSMVPKLWNHTIDAHRREVRDATLETTAALVGKHGILSVTMSQIAEATGIGRATLYKYFPSVEAILFAWHERQIARHVEYLREIGSQGTDAGTRLEAVLGAFALISYERHGDEFSAVLHKGEHVARAQKQLHHFICTLIGEGAKGGSFRNDVSPEELASYCLHALTAAGSLPSKAAVDRLVTVILAGLRPLAATASATDGKPAQR